ncbi:MAG: hypothetical protein SPL32_01060, partial [Succiniclasticum sp.]|nr:hypothetical protein [Succiniclasticum sp.]
MFKKTTAAILLAGMALSLPVYASDATVDEYNSEDKYASPAYHRGAEIVNDWKKSRAAAGEGTMLSETAAVGRPQSEAARRRADAR